jgi:hypothetical protein
MANEQTTGAPLTAPVGDRLKEKERGGGARAAEREPGDIVQVATGRPKWLLLLAGVALFGGLLAVGRLVRR